MAACELSDARCHYSSSISSFHRKAQSWHPGATSMSSCLIARALTNGPLLPVIRGQEGLQQTREQLRLRRKPWLQRYGHNEASHHRNGAACESLRLALKGLANRWLHFLKSRSLRQTRGGSVLTIRTLVQPLPDPHFLSTLVQICSIKRHSNHGSPIHFVAAFPWRKRLALIEQTLTHSGPASLLRTGGVAGNSGCRYSWNFGSPFFLPFPITLSQ